MYIPQLALEAILEPSVYVWSAYTSFKCDTKGTLCARRFLWINWCTGIIIWGSRSTKRKSLEWKVRWTERYCWEKCLCLICEKSSSWKHQRNALANYLALFLRSGVHGSLKDGPCISRKVISAWAISQHAYWRRITRVLLIASVHKRRASDWTLNNGSSNSAEEKSMPLFHIQ